jgi:hypothetical protein
MRVRCRRGDGRGLVLGRVDGPDGPVLIDVGWRLGADGPTVSFRRPPRPAVALAPPSPVRIDLPVGDAAALEALGFRPNGGADGSSAGGRFVAGPGLVSWHLSRWSEPAAAVWFDGAPKGWAVEARLRLEAPAGGKVCAALMIDDLDSAYLVRFEPGEIRIGAQAFPADTEAVATWRIATAAGAQELVVTRDGAEVARVPRVGEPHGEPRLFFGNGCHDGAGTSVWESLALEVGFGEARWQTPAAVRHGLRGASR